jgi:hypothetical protein
VFPSVTKAKHTLGTQSLYEVKRASLNESFKGKNSEVREDGLWMSTTDYASCI